jgi:hypothetical protein
MWPGEQVWPEDPGPGIAAPGDLRDEDARRGGGGPAAGRAAAPGSGDGVRVFVPGAGQPALVAFVDPTCPSCEQLVTSLTQARQAGELAGLRVLLLTSDPPAYLQISAAFRDTPLEIGRPLDQADLESYRPNATPLLVALTADGVVARAGTAARPSEVRAFSQACLLAAPPDALLPVTT